MTMKVWQCRSRETVMQRVGVVCLVLLQVVLHGRVGQGTARRGRAAQGMAGQGMVVVLYSTKAQQCIVMQC